MTSPTDPPKQPLTERISQRISFGSSNSISDPEERFTRNVTFGFVALIVIAALVVIIGLGYGFYDSNLRPLANIGGTEVGRGQYDERLALETFRLDRAETAVRAGLVEGSLDEDLANRRLTSISSARAGLQTRSLERLVDLTFQQQLAAERGIMLGEDELAAAVAADGTSPEARRVSALIIRSSEEELGLPATAEGRADARARAEDAFVALEAGTPFAEVAEEYSPVTASLGGDLGYVERADLTDAAWTEAVFGLDEGGMTEIMLGENGEFLIGQVTDIAEPQPDTVYLTAVRDEIGEGAHSRNVELEAIAAKLEEEVVAEAVAAEFDQVELAEILVRGDTFVDPETDEGSIRASHILYAPSESGAPAPPEDDPAWAEAEGLAEVAATQLRAVDSPETRMIAFASRARRDSDGPTGPNGGDLGFFERSTMVPEFADAVFDPPDLARGDIVGPVRSEFGWHVIMFDERKAPLADRLAEVEAALAADGAEFATVAARLSDGAAALDGGVTGWHRVDDLDELTAITLAATEVGQITEPVEGDIGWYIYLKRDEATMPLEAAAAARLSQTAFSDWYDELRFDAEDEGLITIDQSFFEVSQPPPGG